MADSAVMIVEYKGCQSRAEFIGDIVDEIRALRGDHLDLPLHVMKSMLDECEIIHNG